MVKIYFNGKEKKFVDVNIWSLLKANVLSSLLLVGIFYGLLVIIYLLSYLVF